MSNHMRKLKFCTKKYIFKHLLAYYFVNNQDQPPGKPEVAFWRLIIISHVKN